MNHDCREKPSLTAGGRNERGHVSPGIENLIQQKELGLPILGNPVLVGHSTNG